MDKKLDQAIETLTGMINQSVSSDQALKFTQAALNLAHVKGLLAAEARAGEDRKNMGAGS